MADADATKEALSILGLIKSGTVDLTGLATMPRGPRGGVAPADPELLGNLRDVPRAKEQPGLMGVDDILPLTLGTAGDLVGRRVIPGGGMLFGAIGAGAGRALNQPIYSLFGGEAPSPTGSRVGDVMLEMGGQTFGNLLGLTTAKTGQVATKAVSPAPAADADITLHAFRQAGVDPMVSNVSPNMATLERSVAQTPTGGNIIRQGQDKQALQLNKAADDFLNRVAPADARERMVVGEKVSDSVKRNLEQTGALEDTLWNQLGQMANDVPVRIDNLKAYADEALRKELLGKKPNQAIVSFLRDIVEGGNEWAWQAADATRKQYGREFGGDRSLISEVPMGTYKGAYGALLKDMEATAASSGVPGLGNAYASVRAFSERRREIFRDGEVAKILETDPEQVVKTLKLAGGPSAVTRAREAIVGSNPTPADTEAWNYVRRHILEGIFGDATNPEFKSLANPVIVGSRLEKALAKVGPDTLKELLSDTERQALDNLLTVAKSMRQAEKIGALPGTSATPQGMGFADFMKSPGTLLGTAVGGFLGGPTGAITGGAAGGYASSVMVPHVAAKLLTNPKLAALVASPGFRAIADLSRTGAKGAREATIILGRIGGEIAAEQLGGR